MSHSPYSDPTLPRRGILLALCLTAGVYTLISILDKIYTPTP